MVYSMTNEGYIKFGSQSIILTPSLHIWGAETMKVDIQRND